MKNLTKIVLLIVLLLFAMLLIAKPIPTERQKNHIQKDLQLTYWKYKYGNNFDINNDTIIYSTNPTPSLKLPPIIKKKYNVYYQNGNYIIPRFYINDGRSFYFFRTFF